MADEARKVLIEAYLARREALVRYFALRTRSAAMAEDLVQEIFLKLSALEEASLEAVRNPPAFLYKLGSNLMLDRLKQQRRGAAREAEWQEAQAVEVGGAMAADAPSAEDVVGGRQRLEKMKAVLDELSPQVRRAFDLHKLSGLSHKETAAAMGISRSAVEKYVSHALKQLMRRLE